MSEVKTNKISSLASNNDITIDPDGTGDTIISSGFVGIGTTSPTSKLDANGHIRVTGGTDCDIEFQSGSARRKFIGGDANNLELGTYSSSNTSRDVHISIDSGGFLTHARASGSAQSMVGYKNGSNFVGEIRTSTTATSYITSSDYRLKENVTYTWDATTRLKQLKPARFNFIADADTTVDGFLAHEAQAVVPEAVTGTHNEIDDDGNPVYQGIDQSKIVPLLTKALIESVEKIEQLEARITALEAE